jgi:hypothetical protein
MIPSEEYYSEKLFFTSGKRQTNKNTVKGKFTLKQAIKAYRGSRSTAILFT